MTSLTATWPCGGIFDFENKAQKLEEVNGLLEDPKVWDNAENAQKLGKEKRSLELVVHNLQNLENGLKDARELFDMAREENDDDTLLSVDADTKLLEKQIEDMEFKRMFSGELDSANCFIEFQSGSWWYRGARLGGYAAPHVPALLRAQRL